MDESRESLEEARLREAINTTPAEKFRFLMALMKMNLQMAPVAEIEGIMIPFLPINHLIQNKKIVNRLKDQLDVIALEKIRIILEERAA